jgi:hypothetical protein
MANPLSRRVEQLEHQQPTGLPLIVWCDVEDDVEALTAQAKAQNPGRNILAVGWKTWQAPQGQPA